MMLFLYNENGYKNFINYNAKGIICKIFFLKFMRTVTLINKTNHF